jgi:hypothetical protein
MLNGVEHVPLVANSEAVLHRVVTALQKAKETKSKFLWGFGGIVLGLFINSQVKRKPDEPDSELEE